MILLTAKSMTCQSTPNESRNSCSQNSQTTPHCWGEQLIVSSVLHSWPLFVGSSEYVYLLIVEILVIISQMIAFLCINKDDAQWQNLHNGTESVMNFWTTSPLTHLTFLRWRSRATHQQMPGTLWRWQHYTSWFPPCWSKALRCGVGSFFGHYHRFRSTMKGAVNILDDLQERFRGCRPQTIVITGASRYEQGKRRERFSVEVALIVSLAPVLFSQWNWSRSCQTSGED